MARTVRFRTLARAMAILVLTALVLALTAVSCAKVEMTESGAHQRLLIPIVAGAIGVPIYSGTGEAVFMQGHLDGPVVRRMHDDSWSATWFCQDEAHGKTGRGDTLELECAGRTHRFPLGTPPTPPAVAPMPSELVVLSDLEGNLEFAEAALRKLGIVSPDGGWAFGQGRLVILGDSVDRGRDVFALLWRLHELAGQAHAAGGAVHIVLGNHEQYLLRGNISRAHPDYRYALQQMGGYNAAFAADTIIGNWLRQQPVVLKLGSVVFTHAGVSPRVAGAGLDIDRLNEAMRDYWGDPQARDASPEVMEAILGLSGVTRYRGYFTSLDGHYPKATQAEVDSVLAQFDAKQIVVAHTLVERVEPMYDGRVYAIDVNDDEARSEVLVYNNGAPRVIDIGIPRNLETRPATRRREFSLFTPADRRLIASMHEGFRALSQIPMPY